jgi:CRISPR/Cas system endoribonuclease Cas6 (RAMP superfamily)
MIYFNNQMYKKATLFFSQDSATIAAVVPAMDRLNNHLNPHTKQLYHPAIQAAMKLARNKINHYYSMTDLSSAYQIVMGKPYFIYLFYYSSANNSISPSSRA